MYLIWMNDKNFYTEVVTWVSILFNELAKMQSNSKLYELIILKKNFNLVSDFYFLWCLAEKKFVWFRKVWCSSSFEGFVGTWFGTLSIPYIYFLKVLAYTSIMVWNFIIH